MSILQLRPDRLFAWSILKPSGYILAKALHSQIASASKVFRETDFKCKHLVQLKHTRNPKLVARDQPKNCLARQVSRLKQSVNSSDLFVQPTCMSETSKKLSRPKYEAFAKKRENDINVAKNDNVYRVRRSNFPIRVLPPTHREAIASQKGVGTLV